MRIIGTASTRSLKWRVRNGGLLSVGSVGINLRPERVARLLAIADSLLAGPALGSGGEHPGGGHVEGVEVHFGKAAVEAHRLVRQRHTLIPGVDGFRGSR